jgi:hypothetical protein
MMTVETQDPQDKFFKVIDNKPVIDLYDTQSQESITLNKDTAKITQTTDGLNPNILTAQDADGNTYAFNPNYGWFKTPEIQMDYANLQKYIELEESFIEDGRANIVTALRYAENPTISPDAVAPHYWANYGADGDSNFVYFSYYPSGHFGLAQKKWPDLITYFKPENGPFAWTSFYKVKIGDNKYIYVVACTIKTGDNQTINLFYGFDQTRYETEANNMLPSGRTELELLFDVTNNGGGDLEVILAPPDGVNGTPLNWNPDKVHRIDSPHPDIAKLQKRGELISLFTANDKRTIFDVLSQIRVEYEPGKTTNLWTAPLDHLPPELSKYILLPGFDWR